MSTSFATNIYFIQPFRLPYHLFSLFFLSFFFCLSWSSFLSLSISLFRLSLLALIFIHGEAKQPSRRRAGNGCVWLTVLHSGTRGSEAAAEDCARQAGIQHHGHFTENGAAQRDIEASRRISLVLVF